jgi:hypothetical protein
LFGLNVLIESKVLLRPTTPSETINTTIKFLIELALKKPWLREPSSKVLCAFAASISQLKNGKSVAQDVVHGLDESGLIRTQDGAAIVLSLNALPKAFKPKVSSKSWQHGNPLHSSNLALFSKVLKEIPSEDDTIKTTGNFKGDIHFIWSLILERYSADAKDVVRFADLWDTVVESRSTVK